MNTKPTPAAAAPDPTPLLLLGLTLLAAWPAPSRGAGAGPGQPDPGPGPADTAAPYVASPADRMPELPTFASVRGSLPAPVLDARPDLVAMYWKAWELASRNFYQPPPGSGFVSTFIDAAFNENIFLWDTCFMTMYCNVAHPLVPGIASLDNFYVKQHPDGEICREIVRASGAEFGPWVNREGLPLFSRFGWNPGDWPPRAVNAPVRYLGRAVPEPPPLLTLEALNNPLASWAELESFRTTGDAGRIARVYLPLVRYYRALRKYLRQGNGLYVTDWASMDNSPRNPRLAGGGAAVDTSCQMAMFGRDLAEMAALLGRAAEARAFTAEADELARAINALMWDPQRRFYFDLSLDGSRAGVKTVAAYYALLGRVASPEQAGDLAAELENPRTFGRLHRVPTVAADETGFDPAGGYWRGAVWAPTTTVVIRGLERYGRLEQARAIALNDLEITGAVFRDTGTLWENYAPDARRQGKPAKAAYVGWSAIAPILYLLEFEIGLRPDAPANTLVWDLRLDAASPGRVGCERYRFGGHVASLTAAAGPDPGTVRVTVASDGSFRLRVLRGSGHEDVEVHPGSQEIRL